jgi:erythromycin esterase-like protein
VAAICSEATPWTGSEANLEAVVDLAGDAHFVLLGAASHGTHEFYADRARITQRLIAEKGFCAVAVEADWPDAYRVNRYVRGRNEDATAEEALRGFNRFPTWMWRNAVVSDFVDWLRGRNDRLGHDERTKTGFYGLDLYSLFRSIDEVIRYLERVDPDAARRARERYSCFDSFGEDAQAYGAAAFGAGDSCQTDAVAQLVDLQRHALEHSRQHGLVADDDLFDAVQNAMTVADAEAYYRTMFGSRVSTWNLRARHMAETLNALVIHLSRQRGELARVVVWAHNSHLGDARATDQGLGEINLGQLVREQHLGDSLLVGFTTYAGTVTAADRWGGPAECKLVRPAAPGSVEELFHQTGEEALLIPFAKALRAAELLRGVRLERAIGVVYRPDDEERSHYFRTRLADQFDAVVHIDGTRFVEPLDRTAQPDRAELAETYPFGV